MLTREIAQSAGYAAAEEERWIRWEMQSKIRTMIENYGCGVIRSGLVLISGIGGTHSNPDWFTQRPRIEEPPEMRQRT